MTLAAEPCEPPIPSISCGAFYPRPIGGTHTSCVDGMPTTNLSLAGKP